MIYEFASGAYAQLGRFVGSLPRVFGWSATLGDTPPVPTAPAEVTLIVGPISRTLTVGPITRTLTAPAISRTLTCPDPE